MATVTCRTTLVIVCEPGELSVAQTALDSYGLTDRTADGNTITVAIPDVVTSWAP